MAPVEFKRQLTLVDKLRALAGSLWLVIKSSPVFLVVTVIEETLNSAIPFATAWLTANLISALPAVVRHTATTQQVVMYLILIAALTVFSTVAGSVLSYFGNLQESTIELALKRRLQTAYASLPLALYEDVKVIDAFSRAEEYARKTVYFILSDVQSLYGWLVTAVIAGVAFWHFSPALTLGILVLSLPLVWLELQLERYRDKAWSGNQRLFRKAGAYSSMVEPRVIKEARLLGVTSYAIDKAQHFLRRFNEKSFAMRRKQEIYQLANTAFAAVIEVAVLFHALQEIIAGVLPVGQFVFVQQLTSRFLYAVSGISRQVRGLDELFVGLPEYMAIVTYKPKDGGELVHDPTGDITFHDVWFTYPLAPEPAIKGLSLTVKGGQTVAFVGQNGAGKTTLVKLLMKLYEPSKGNISIAGQPLASINSNEWYTQLGVLFQDFNLFYELPLRDNIWFGNIAAENADAVIDRALQAAEAYDFVHEMPHGLDSYLGKWVDDEKGTDISGGQAQRLAIARTLFRDPPILILDEPTSAIDAKAEYAIFKSIEAARKGKTTILISHRFSTVRKADYIYVLDRGSLAEQGTHDELMAKQGVYYEMFTKQAEGYR